MKQRFDRAFLFFFLAMASGAVSRIFGGHGSLQAGGSNSTAISSGNSDPVLLLFSVLLTGTTLFVLFRKIRAIGAVFVGMTGIPFLYLFAAASMVWSAGPTSTFRSLVYLFIYLAASAYLAVTFDEKDLVRHIANVMIVLGLLSIPGQFLLAPNGDLAPGWTGVFPQKNDLGAAMAIGVAALFASRQRWNMARISGLVLCVALLLLSQSFTAVLTAALALVAVWYARSSSQVRLLLLYLCACSALVIAFSMGSLEDTFTNTTGKDLTFTGRTEIWELVEAKIIERPLLGFGYGAFWATQADAINQFSVWKPGQAHNGYLDICLNLGALGLVFVLLLIRESLRRARRLRTKYGSDAGIWLFVVVVILLVRNCAEASFLDLSLTWSMLPIAAFSARKTEYLVSIESTPAAELVETMPMLTPGSATVLP